MRLKELLPQPTREELRTVIVLAAQLEAQLAQLSAGALQEEA